MHVCVLVVVKNSSIESNCRSFLEVFATPDCASCIAVVLGQHLLQEGELHALTRKDSRKEQTTDLADMSVKKQSHISTGVENSVACSSISGDFSSSDQQFARCTFVCNRFFVLF